MDESEYYYGQVRAILIGGPVAGQRLEREQFMRDGVPAEQVIVPIPLKVAVSPYPLSPADLETIVEDRATYYLFPVCMNNRKLATYAHSDYFKSGGPSFDILVQLVNGYRPHLGQTTG